MSHQDAMLEAAAERLRQAYETGPIMALRNYLAVDDFVGAYAVQRINSLHWAGGGRRATGRKIGLTARAIQEQLGADQPDHGVLYADMAVADGGEVGWGKLLQPRVEAEVALVLERDIALPDATVQDIVRCTAYAACAIEIVDSRIEGWKASAADMIADNGFAAAYVVSPLGRKLQELDLVTCGMVMEVNGRVASLGAGAACLGHPLASAAWLARALARTHQPLVAGDVILTGSLGPMVPVVPRDVVHVRIGGLGEVRVLFGE